MLTATPCTQRSDAEHALRRERLEAPVLAGQHRRPQRLVGREGVCGLGQLGEALFAELHTRPAERVRHCRLPVGEHRHPHQHRLDERHAEALVFGHRDEDARRRVARDEFVVRDVPEEHHLVGREALLVGERLERVEVRAPAGQLAHEHHAHVLRQEALPIAREADQVIGALVRREAPDEQQVGATVLQHAEQHRARRLAVAVEVEQDRQHPRARDAQRRELEPVELAVGEPEVAVRRQRTELLAPDAADASELVVPAHEVLGRGDVVVQQHAPAAVLAERRR